MKHHFRQYASSLNRMLTHSLKRWRLLPVRLHPSTNRGAIMARFFGISVLAAVVALSLAACGGGGGAPAAADPAPPVTPAKVKVTVTSVTLTPSPSGDGMVADLKASGSNGSDAVADLTKAVTDAKGWTVKVTVVPALADQAKLSVTATGRLQYDGKDLLVLPGQSAGVEATASLNSSSAKVAQTVTVPGCGDGLKLAGIKCMVPPTAWMASTAIWADVSVVPATASWRQLSMSDDGVTVVRLVLPQGTHNCGYDGTVGDRGGFMVSCSGLTGYTPATYQVWPSSDRKSLLTTKVGDADLRETASYLAVSLSHKLEWALCVADGVATGREVPGTTPQVCNRDKELSWTGGGTVATPGLQALIAPVTLKQR